MMKRARILGCVPSTTSLAVEDAEGRKQLFQRGHTIPQEAVERSRYGAPDPPIAIHADIMGWYPIADVTKFLFNYEGDELPRLLRIRDGGDTGYHEFHHAGLYVE
jgi:hypothetical protein